MEIISLASIKLVLLSLQARTRALIMGELLKSVRNSQSQTSAIPRASPDQYMTVAQVSRDFSSVCSVTQDGGDLVVFLVGNECVVGGWVCRGCRGNRGRGIFDNFEWVEHHGSFYSQPFLDQSSWFLHPISGRIHVSYDKDILIPTPSLQPPLPRLGLSG